MDDEMLEVLGETVPLDGARRLETMASQTYRVTAYVESAMAPAEIRRILETQRGRLLGPSQTGWHVTMRKPGQDLGQAAAAALDLLQQLGPVQALTIQAETSTGSRERGGELTVPQAATELGVTQQALRKRLRKGTLPGRRAGNTWLIPRSAIEVHRSVAH